MTRLFREGRTETVRSCTMESCAFVRSMIRDETVRVTPSTQSATSHFGILSRSHISSLIRQKSVWGCWKRQLKSTKACTAWRWREEASTATSSVFMWSPNTSEKTQPSSRRYGGARASRCPLVTVDAKQTVCVTKNKCVSGPVWALEAVHQSDSCAAGGALWPCQTSRVRVFRRWLWSGRYSFNLHHGFKRVAFVAVSEFLNSSRLSRWLMTVTASPTSLWARIWSIFTSPASAPVQKL